MPPLEAERQFVHRLRRALLNSRQYTEWPVVRLIVGALGRGLPIAAGALTLGFFAALGVKHYPTADPVMRPGKPPTSIVVANPTVLEHLNSQGQLQSVTLDADGVRLYRINLASGETLELLDPAPYAIRLTNE